MAEKKGKRSCFINIWQNNVNSQSVDIEKFSFAVNELIHVLRAQNIFFKEKESNDENS